MKDHDIELVLIPKTSKTWDREAKGLWLLFALSSFRQLRLSQATRANYCSGVACVTDTPLCCHGRRKYEDT